MNTKSPSPEIQTRWPELPRLGLLPVVALLGVFVAAIAITVTMPEPAPASSVGTPPEPSYESAIAGAGLVEPRSESISVGSHLSGIVVKVFVEAGDKVAAGAPLFSLDDRHYIAEREVRRAAVAIAVAELGEARTLWEMVDSIKEEGVISREDREKRRHALEIAAAKVKGAEAALAAITTDIARLTVNAPIAGTILQVNTRVGEAASNASDAPALMVIGDVGELFVRVDIDENDAWRFAPGARATGHLKGEANLSVPLQFVRVEPFIIPKRSLTGGSTERVDTRVLQVLYAFDPKLLPAYVGQQMDVFVESSSIEPVRPAN